MTAPSEAICPFCAAPWSAEMLAQLDRFTVASGCACCGGGPAQHSAPAAPLPTEDIACSACGRAIYRAVATAGHQGGSDK